MVLTKKKLLCIGIPVQKFSVITFVVSISLISTGTLLLFYEFKLESFNFDSSINTNFVLSCVMHLVASWCCF